MLCWDLMLPLATAADPIHPDTSEENQAQFKSSDYDWK